MTQKTHTAYLDTSVGKVDPVLSGCVVVVPVLVVGEDGPVVGIVDAVLVVVDRGDGGILGLVVTGGRRGVEGGGRREGQKGGGKEDLWGLKREGGCCTKRH